MSNYLLQQFGENEPTNANKTQQEPTYANKETAEDIKLYLSELGIKFLMIDAAYLKKMYGPTFATLYQMASGILED